jgi:hypothetical protein
MNHGGVPCARHWRARARMLVVIPMFLAPATARADIPWDASFSFGASRRLLEDSFYGQGRVGGRMAADAHITTLRVVRVGLGGYAELSPYENFGARRFFGAGLRLGARIPVPTERVRFFVGTGFNYVGVVAPSKEYAIVRPSFTVEGTLLEAGGRMLEVPLTLGAALPLAKDFHLLFQGGASMSFAQSGSYYDSPSTVAEYRLTSSEYREASGKSASTVRTHTTELLNKAGEDKLEQLALRTLRHALHGRH